MCNLKNGQGGVGVPVSQLTRNKAITREHGVVCAMIAYNCLVYSLPAAVGLGVCGTRMESLCLLWVLTRNMGVCF